NCRIVNNRVYNNKIDSEANQGGWGIVASVSVSHFVIANNICTGNQRGGITVDTYTYDTPSWTDAYFSVSNNVIDGSGPLNPSGFSATGISINGARQGVVSDNFIRRATQGIHTSDPRNLTIS